jgi:hypothetical protein
VVGALVSRFGALEIDVEDTVKAILATPSTAIELSLDYLSRTYRRGLDVLGSEGNLHLDWSSQTIEVRTPDHTRVDDVAADIAESYVLEDQCFLDWLGGAGHPPVLAEEGAASVRLADQIRRWAR